MDSVSQAVLGAALAGVISGRSCSPKLLLTGAALGTVPDLDVFLDYGDPILNMVKHRGFTHSLFVLPLFSVILAVCLHRFLLPDWSFKRVCFLVLSILVTHPLLDAFTSYGTQLFWPLAVPPVSISSIAIIDPFYTLPLLITVIASVIWRERIRTLCAVGLIISTSYLGWSLYAQHLILQRVHVELVNRGINAERIFVTPTLFNTVLWRVLVIDGDEYKDGLLSLLDEDPTINWLTTETGAWVLEEKPGSLTELEAFTQGFYRYQQEGEELILSDLRLGMAMNLPFQFVVARQDPQGQWQETVVIKQDPTPPLPRHIIAMWMRLLGKQSIDSMLCNPHDCYPKETK